MKENKVYVIQEVAGTQSGSPKINIMGAAKYGKFEFLLPEFSQIIFSPGPLIFKLRKALKNFTTEDYLLLTGDPAIIGVACSIVSDMTNGKYNLLKWDKQEKAYYPIPNIQSHDWGEIRRQRKNEAIQKMLKAELIAVKKEKGKSTKVRLLVK